MAAMQIVQCNIMAVARLLCKDANRKVCKLNGLRGVVDKRAEW